MQFAKCHPHRKHNARGLCNTCYSRWLRDNNPEYVKRQRISARAWAQENPDKVKILQERRKEKRKVDPEAILSRREDWLIRRYGITTDDYDRMLEAQKGVCALCGRLPGARLLHVDHCHDTDRVRGLLCHQCNWYLGTIDADPSILDRIKKYREAS